MCNFKTLMAMIGVRAVEQESMLEKFSNNYFSQQYKLVAMPPNLRMQIAWARNQGLQQFHSPYKKPHPKYKKHVMPDLAKNMRSIHWPLKWTKKVLA